jgi:hypothetical protein
MGIKIKFGKHDRVFQMNIPSISLRYGGDPHTIFVAPPKVEFKYED